MCVPGYPTGHLDACSVANSVTNAHTGHLVYCCHRFTESAQGTRYNGIAVENASDDGYNLKGRSRSVLHLLTEETKVALFVGENGGTDGAALNPAISGATWAFSSFSAGQKRSLYPGERYRAYGTSELL